MIDEEVITFSVVMFYCELKEADQGKKKKEENREALVEADETR